MTPVNLLSTIRTGLLDSINPGGITAAVIFAVFLFAVIKWQGPALIVWSGTAFIGGSVVTTGLINLGIYDNIFYSPKFDTLLDWAHFIIEFGSLVIGIICLRDWWIYKKTKDVRKLVIRFPFITDELEGSAKSQTDKKPQWLLFLLAVIAYLAGAGMTFLLSPWPCDQAYFSVLHYRVWTPGLQWSTICSLILYGLFYSWFLILELIGCRKVATLSEIREKLRRALPKVQVIVAALFLAYGITMLYFYYIRFYWLEYKN